MIRGFNDYTGDIEEACDVCIIGSGAGGAVAAKEISGRGYSVVLVEEGGYYKKEDWNGKPLYSMVNMWRNGGGIMALGYPPVSITLGKCIGGTTTVNSGTCFRTPDMILKKWRDELGLDNLTKENLERYFKKVEGEINVTELSWDVLGNIAKIVKRGADKLGLNCRPLKHNVRDCRGCGTCQFGCPDGAKQSADVTYIPEAVNNGARVYADCRADKILIKKGIARGVSCSIIDPAAKKPVYKMNVRAEIVVAACGTMLTPLIIKKSGVRNPNVGRHLQIHPCTRVAAIMDEKVEGWKGVSQGVYIDDFFDEGIMLEGIFVHPSILLAGFPGTGMKFKEYAANIDKIATFGVMAHDSTTGRVWGSHKDFILSSYLLEESDAEKLKKGIAHTAKIFFAAGARKVLTPVYKMSELNSMDDADELLKMKMKPGYLAEVFAFHPLGTCRMSSGRENGVIDKNGESFDVKNLFVADGSAIPTSLGVNPQVTIMSISAMISEFIVKRLGR